MTISVGEQLPQGSLMKLGTEGPEPVSLDAITKGRKVVLFGVPGAFTALCSSAHLPSFMRTADAFRAKGIDDIICMSVNDPWVMEAWDQASGASGAGIKMLADPDGRLTVAMGLDFSGPPVGFVNRARRFAAVIDDGVVVTLQEEQDTHVCNFTSGETLLETL